MAHTADGAAGAASDGDSPTDEAGSEPGGGPPPPRVTRLIYAGFICAIGYAVLVVVFSQLPAAAAKDTEAWVYLWPLVAAAIACAALFVAINSSRVRGRSIARRPHQRLDLRIAIFGALALILAALGFQGAAYPKDQPRIIDQYAINLPAYNLPGDGAPAADQDLRAGPAMTKSGTPRRPAVQLIWLVARADQGLSSGVLPMFMGGLLAIAFGLAYPHISPKASDDALGWAEKLLAPLLSIALVAVGAGQHADAQKAEAAANMVRQGLPPQVYLDPTTFKAQLHVIADGELNPETAELLRQRVNDLATQLAAYQNEHGRVDEGQRAAIQDVVQRLASIESVLRKGVKTGNPEVTRDDVRQLSNAITSLQDRVNDLGATAQDQKDLRAAQCDAARQMLAHFTENSPDALKAKAAALNREARLAPLENVLIWLRLEEPKPDGREVREDAARAAANQDYWSRSVVQYCGPSTKAAN
jgi:polyhydroxyalkanoate synthesis regulator phasin